jgi:malate synthase
MGDAATAEISRAQIWQWVHQQAKLSDGRVIGVPLVESLITAELEKQKAAVDAARYAAYEKAAGLMRELIESPQFIEFLTLPAYQRVLKEETFTAV